MGARLPRAAPRPGADRGDAALRGDPLQGHARARPAPARRRARRACPTARALPGATAFRLYDTFGFPLDLTQDALREKHRAVDVAGFEAAMAEQKAKARAAWAGSGEAADEAVWFDLAEKLGADRVPRLRHRDRRGPDRWRSSSAATPVETAPIGVEVQIVLNQTPVLRRVRRPGRRHRHAQDRPRPRRDHRRAQEGRPLRPPGPGRGGRARPRRRRRARGRPRPPHRDPRQPLRDPPAARGAAPRARRPRRPARQPGRARPAALRLHPRQGDDARPSSPPSRPRSTPTSARTPRSRPGS